MSRDVTESRAAEGKLRKNESLLSQAEEIAHLGSWEFDMGSIRPRLSKNLLQMYGVSPDEEFTRESYIERVHPRDRARVRKVLDEAMVNGEPFEYELRYILPNGETRFFYTQGIPIEGPDGKTARILGVVQDVTDSKRAQDDVRQLWRQMIQGRDEERRRMARELHESAGQSLAALKMNLSRLHESLPKSRKLAHTLWRTSVELADAAVREVRTVSYLMHPPLLDEAGLAPALRWYARGFAERSKIVVAVDIADDFGRAPQEVETTVFRVVQEALTNVHRYSGSSTACIRVSREDRRLLAEVKDEGCGLTAVAPQGAGSQVLPGVGIAGMRERVQHLNGTFQIESVPGRGTLVRVTLPLDAGADQTQHDGSAAEKLA
jgi:PAS domain S-box-containing protein